MARITSARIGPWPDVATARFFLSGLATGEWDGRDGTLLEELDQTVLGEWFVQHGLAPLAYDRCRDVFPALAAQLVDTFYLAAGHNILRFHELSRVLDRFRIAGIPVVLFKGAALAEGVCGGIGSRAMGDVDIWLRTEDMGTAAGIMQGLGFQLHTRPDRPPALQLLLQGEIQFSKWGLVELHWSPFPGWWLRRMADIDHGEVWERKEPLAIGGWSVVERSASADEGRAGLVFQLSAEDSVIQVATHLAVNHQFGMVPVRGLMDVALTARARRVDWALVAERARRWRVGTVVWAVLDLAESLIGLPGADVALARLQPSLLRRALLRRFVSPGSVLAGRDLRGTRARYLLLLLVVDRLRDAVWLVFRTLWPEEEWLKARYGEGWSRWRHLWSVVRYGEV